MVYKQRTSACLVTTAILCGLVLSGCTDENQADAPLSGPETVETTSMPDPDSSTPDPDASDHTVDPPDSYDGAPDSGGGEAGLGHVSDSLTQELMSVAVADGYSPDDGPQNTEIIGYLALDLCDQFANDPSAIQDHIAEDISTGAPPAAARHFNQYVRDGFCPQVG